MKTFWSDIKRIEDFLHGNLDHEESLLLEAKAVVDPLLRVRINFQKKAYGMIKMYGRSKIRSALEIQHKRLFSDPEKDSFCKRVNGIFD